MRTAALGVIVGVLALAGTPVYGQEDGVVSDSHMTQLGSVGIEVDGSDESEDSSDPVNDPVNEDVAEELVDPVDMGGDRPRWIALPRPGSTEDVDDGNGGWCRDVEYVDVSGLTGEEEAELIQDRNGAFSRSAEQAAYTRMTGVVDADLLCPIEEMEGLDPVFIELYVREAIEEQVPRPDPHIPPGHALAGMPAYLVTEHELTVGPIEIDMDLGFTTVQGTVTGTAVTTVDWGDGTQTEHHVAGMPYPEGEVTHTFADQGEVSIEVVDRWHVEYEAADGAIAGTLVETLNPVTIDAFEIREYRAVRAGGS